MNYHFNNDFIVQERGAYKVVVVSASYFTSKFGREGVKLLFMDIKTKKFIQLYLMTLTQKGNVRKKPKQMLDDLLILGNILELKPEYGMEQELNFKEKKIQENEAIIYPELIGKKYWLDLAVRLNYQNMVYYVNYHILGIYKADTQQSATEYKQNQIATEFKRIAREHRRDNKRHKKERFEEW